MRTGRVNSRQFNRLFVLQKPRVASGEHVDLTEDNNWTSHGDYWLKLYSPSSREFFRAQQTFADVTHVADVMYSKVTAELTTAMRWLGANDRVMQILTAFDPDDNHEVIQMALVEAK